MCDQCGNGHKAYFVANALIYSTIENKEKKLKAETSLATWQRHIASNYEYSLENHCSTMDFTHFFKTKHLKKEKKSGLLSDISSYYTFKYNYDI